jgi:hypothetical protein
MRDPRPQVLEKALEAMEEQMKTERDFHVVQLTRVHANTIERFQNTVERREVWGWAVPVESSLL